ncbi:MAG: hypothetical protein GC204_13710 [Chloroflexi bacterium]|nr:hypothetical protein [Chloroflexota bacterium]
MRRRYYRDDDAAIAEFVAWSMILTGKGLMEVVKWLTRPGAYTPYSPDEPRQVSGLLEHVPKIDWSQAGLPKVDAGSLKRFKGVRSLKDLKAAAQNLSDDLKSVQVSWSPGDRPQLIPRPEVAHPFFFPQVVGEPRAYRITPVMAEANPQASVDLMRDLMAATPRLTFEIVGDGKETVWQIVDYEGRYPSQMITDHIRTHHAGAVVEQVDPTVLPARQYPFFRQLLVFGLTNEYAAPLPFWGEVKGSDSLATLTRRMDFLDPVQEERVQYQLFSFTFSEEAGNRAGKRLLRGTVRPTSGIIEDKSDPLSGFDLELLNAKLANPLYHTFVAVTVESRDEKRLDEIAQVAHDVMRVHLPRYNGMTLVGSPSLKHPVDSEEFATIAWFETLLTAMVKSYQPEWRRILSVLSPPEMATLWHLPDETYTGEKIVWASSAIPKELIATDFKPTQQLLIGDVITTGKTTPIALPLADRVYHQTIVGKTGVGKSTLLLNLIHQDIAAGRGVAVIDPHGKLIDDILTTSVPPKRAKDVVLLDCGRSDFPVPLNPFRIPEGVSFASAFNYVYWAMRKIYESIWQEGQTDRVMRHVIEALLCDPEATPLDIRRLFADDAYRAKLVEMMEDNDDVSFDTVDFWQDFDERSEGGIREMARPILNRTSAFVGRRTLELMTCHPKSLNFQAFIRDKKIVLINLSGDEIVNEVGSLGALFVSGFYLASEALGYVADGQPPRYVLAIDEVERFMTTPLGDLFSQARKMGLSLTIANQYLDQLSKATLQAITGTVGTQFLFELGLNDAQTFRPLVEPEMAWEELLHLGVYRMAVKTRAEGRTLPALVVATRPKPKESKTPYVRADTVPDRMNGKDVRAWIRTRRSPKKNPDDETNKPGDESDVTDFE